jgi:hypothetical protein
MTVKRTVQTRVLRLIEETSDSIVGEDTSAVAYRFLKKGVRSYVLNRRFEEVVVRYTSGQLVKLETNPSESLSPMQETALRSVQRDCLICGHTFKALPQMRVCNPCKEGWASLGGLDEHAIVRP